MNEKGDTMKTKQFQQSDYMSLQLMEIEKFRMILSKQTSQPVSFQEAVMLWITEGYAEAFRSQYFSTHNNVKPASA